MNKPALTGLIYSLALLAAGCSNDDGSGDNSLPPMFVLASDDVIKTEAGAVITAQARTENGDGLLDNDLIDQNGIITAVGTSDKGSISFTEDSVTFTPTDNTFIGDASFTYSISHDGLSDTGNITVKGLQLLPVTVEPEYGITTPEGLRTLNPELTAKLKDNLTINTIGGSNSFSFGQNDDNAFVGFFKSDALNVPMTLSTVVSGGEGREVTLLRYFDTFENTALANPGGIAPNPKLDPVTTARYVLVASAMAAALFPEDGGASQTNIQAIIDAAFDASQLSLTQDAVNTAFVDAVADLDNDRVITMATVIDLLLSNSTFELPEAIKVNGENVAQPVINNINDLLTSIADYNAFVTANTDAVFIVAFGSMATYSLM